MFVPNVGKSKLGFSQKSQDDPIAKHPNKTKTYEILNRYYYWPWIINDVKGFVKNCYGCKKTKTSKNKYHSVFKPLSMNKMVKCIFMDGITIKNVARVFYIHVWKNHGLHNFFLNRGRPFVNNF